MRTSGSLGGQLAWLMLRALECLVVMADLAEADDRLLLHFE